MGMSEVHIEKPRPPRRAFRFQTPILTGSGNTNPKTLLGFLARPAPGAGLALCSQLAEVFRPAHCGKRTAALMPHDGGGAHTLLADEIVHQGERGAEIFTGTGRAVLGKVWSGFENQVGIRNQVAKGF